MKTFFRRFGQRLENMGKPFKCDYTPYVREILDSFDPSKPSKEVVIIKGCSVGGTEASLNELIANNPIPHIDELRRFGAIQYEIKPSDLL